MELIFTSDFGRFKKGDLYEARTGRDVQYLCKEQSVAMPKQVYDAAQVDPRTSEGPSVEIATELQVAAQSKLQKYYNPDSMDPYYPAKENHYAVFNTCTHTFLDLRKIKDLTASNNMRTVSIRLPNGDYLTLCVIPDSDDTEGSGCIDIEYHGDREQRIRAFKDKAESQDVENFNFHTLIYGGPHSK